MVFCNPSRYTWSLIKGEGHNPYFNRWFSAIMFFVPLFFHGNSHNPYFNRWFSAIRGSQSLFSSVQLDLGHNPYFNRWFSAISLKERK